ncbi:myoneurin-like isoform X19 [Pectinophora gossypiella]|uniref:myoneurin-like isoform X19 n=1 Tax=Pectinophora gossypiella TaxID=13191 RepID=UPI00214E4A3C|nr:myoneurin-like isoform X19 [Pectinophora gossypiella]
MTAKSSDWRPGPSVCRCCFAEGCYKDISTEYFWMGKREVYQEMLSTTFDVSISYAQSGGPNSNSRLICEPCIARLRDASDFKRQVQECERVFHQHLDPTSSVSELEAVVVEPPGKEVKLERVKVESKLSDDEDFDDHAFVDDDDDDLDDQPLTALATKVPKKESVDLMDLLDNAKPEKRKAAAKPKTPPAKKAKKKESPKPSASKPAPKPVEKKRKVIFIRGDLDAASCNAAIVLETSTAYPVHIRLNSLRCYFCKLDFNDPREFRTHVASQHPAVNKSSIIKKKFQTRVDITDLKCRGCPKKDIFLSLESFAEHLNDKHDYKIDISQGIALVPLRLDKDHNTCIVCNKIFKTVISLSRHTGTHFYRHVCDTCGRRFETPHGLNTHAEHCLIQAKYFCKLCKTSFPSAEEKAEHVRTTEYCKPYKCKTCKIGFTRHETRQKHFEDVHGHDKIIRECVECKQIFDTRMKLFEHFKAAHTDDYKCEHCGRRFGTGQHLKKHLNKHLGLKPYTCQICNKSFNSASTHKSHLIVHDDSKKTPCPVCNKLFVARTKMVGHVKKHHPEFEL